MAERVFTIRPDLAEEIRNLPHSPGVYQMKDENGRILYVGKSKNLCSRVSSYFSGAKDRKTELLRRKVVQIDVILCANDYEAMILENNLIKKHSPRYNINLKDDKRYPYLCVSAEAYPRLFKTRRVVEDGSEYYGPYPKVLELELTMELIQNLFSLRLCQGPLRSRKKPCLYFHLRRCSGPCIGAVSREEYGQRVRKARKLLEGSADGLRNQLEQKMHRAARELCFEEAALLRDQLRSLESIQSDQSMEIQERVEVARDYLATLRFGDNYFFTVLTLRQGKVIGSDHFSSRYLPDPADGEDSGQEGKALIEFLCQYYFERGQELPDELFLPDLSGFGEISGELELFLRLLRERRGRGFILRGDRDSWSKSDRLLALRAKENVIREQRVLTRSEGTVGMLEELKKVLQLKALPEHIEGFDISHMDGRDTVASLVCFRSGKPSPKEYRNFMIRGTEGMPNDVRSIQEAVSRRYTRLLNEGRPLPDLILIDGGKPQANAAAKILRELEIVVPLVGLAKREETLFLPCIPGADSPVRDRYSIRLPPISLPLGSPALKLLQRVRDENHRVAHKHNRKRREDRMRRSVLENVPGLGEKRSIRLLRHYGSLEKMSEASPEELAEAGKMGLKMAETLRHYLILKS